MDNITREKCEELIKGKLAEIYDIYRAYNNNGVCLTIFITEEDGKPLYNFWNRYYDNEDDENEDINKPINYRGV